MTSLSGRKPSDRKLTWGQISKVQLASWTKMKAKPGNRLPSMILTTQKRYRMSYFFVQCYCAWLIDARETVGISCFQRTKKIILCWSHVSVLWISKAKWAQKYYPLYIHFKAECLKEYARRLHNVHYEAFPFVEIMFGKDTPARLPEEVKVFIEETGMDVSNNQE